MNKLSAEFSPYLRQNAYDPVNWYPWGEEAFKKASLEDKPIFLSIGYSTCHWCHVMQNESFRDETVAAILNRDYVAIKVDREERPDIDSVYMAVCTALTGSGGWPLTVIMTPEQKPFFAATYIPRDSHSDRPGLIMLLTALASKWQSERAALLSAAGEITELLKRSHSGGGDMPGEELLKSAFVQLSASFDEEYGGFGAGMKFPMVQELQFLLRYSHFTGDKAARRMLDKSLQQMYRGGIYDHIGGGFARYSTDREWLVPHFEKTLYDNALLALIYTEAWQDGHYPLYREIAEATLDYCLRELRDENGGFYCAQDADSGGIEGAYYLFTPEEVVSVLGENEGRHFCECYDITKEGNYKGKSIPNILLNQRWYLIPEGYGDYRERLRDYRREKRALDTDKKQLLGWNALMLSALSRAYTAFGTRRYLEAADKLRDFLCSFGDKLCCIDGVYLHTAPLDALSLYALSLIEHYNTGYDAKNLLKAAELAGRIISEFKDPDGGYFDTPLSGEKLIIRPKTVYDSALPSGNSAVAVLFDKLFRLSGDIKWREERDSQLRFIASSLERYPAGCAFALTALMSAVYPTRELVCACNELIPSSLYMLTEKYAPELTVLVKTAENADALAAFAPHTADMKPFSSSSALYLCTDGKCQAPIAVE